MGLVVSTGRRVETKGFDPGFFCFSWRDDELKIDITSTGFWNLRTQIMVVEFCNLFIFSIFRGNFPLQKKSSRGPSEIFPCR